MKHESSLPKSGCGRPRHARGRSSRSGWSAVAIIGLATSLWFAWDADQQRALAERAADQASRSERDEATARADAEQSLANFDRLAHASRLENARRQEATLHPSWPEQAAAMRTWLDEDASQLVAALPELRATITSLAARAAPPQGEPPNSPSFSSESDAFLRATLLRLVAGIEAFAANEIVEVEQRLRWAEQVEETDHLENPGPLDRGAPGSPPSRRHDCEPALCAGTDRTRTADGSGADRHESDHRPLGVLSPAIGVRPGARRRPG